MKKLEKKTSLDLWHVTMAAGSRTQILLLSHTCDIVTSQTWKVDERKRVEQEDIEKMVGIFTFWMVF